MRLLPLAARICGAALLLSSGALASAALAEPDAATSILVKLRAEGPHGIHACAEASFRRGRPLAASAEDGSDSLDRLASELGVRGVRAVFRRPDGTPFAAQRERLRARLQPSEGRGAEADGAPVPDLAHVYRIELPEGVAARDAAERFASDPHVVYAQPNYRIDRDASLDDPFLSSNGTWGQPYADQWGVHAIGAPDAWDTTLGEGVVIAVVDTGVDLAHPDLAGNLWVHPGEDLDGDGVADPEEWNGIDDDGNGFVDDLVGWDFQGSPGAGEDADPTDEDGHGTHVAGIAAARGGNGIGIAGVAPRATVMPVRVFPPQVGADSDVVYGGVLYAVLNGADVINASFSCGVVCRSSPLAEEVLAIAAQHGVVYVTSAGNAAADVMLKSPERLRSSIVVGSVAASGGLAGSSSFGYLVDVVAPGVDVLSLAAAAAPTFYPAASFVGSDYIRFSGTSMATPHVSGVVALLLAARPDLTFDEVRALLHASARDRGAPGPDPVFGRGLVQPAAALALGRPLQLFGEIRSPLPGDTLDSRAEDIPITGRVVGADLAGYRLEIGEGSVPEHWTPLETVAPAPFEDAEIARLPLARLSDGPYVLRLTLVAQGGAEVVEFTPISVERARPGFVSPEGGDARNPDLHGETVVWEEHPSDDDEGATARLMKGRFGRTGGRVLAPDSPADQLAPAISSWGVAWLEQSGDEVFRDSDLFLCRLRGERDCRPRPASSPPAFREHLQLSGRNLVVLEARGGARSLAACRASRGGCVPREVATEVPNPEFPALDGRRLVFGRTGEGLFTCQLGPAATSCPASPLALPGTFFPRALALSGRTLAYVGATAAHAGLFACELTDSGECQGGPIASLDPTYDASADLSGRRLVWDAPGAFGQPDVYYCELGAGADGCAVQRVTSDAASQVRPRVDGPRLVWEDERGGDRRIAALRLPTILAPAHRRVREGAWLAIPVRAAGVETATLSAATREGEDVSTLGAHWDQRSATVARLRWRPGPDQVGAHELVLRATLPGGLYTEQVLVIEVAPRGRPRH